MTAHEMPREIEDLVDELAGMPGVVGVVLGGSRATGDIDAGSDWDLGVYYRGTPDLGALARRGTVHPPGSWGRIMNGGSWLTIGARKVDVLLRDIDIVEHWSARARAGEYDVDLLLGYLAGIPTYSVLAERAVAIPLRGTPPAAEPFPDALAQTGPARWRFHRDFSLTQGRARALRGDLAGLVGHAARATIEHAHALLCERRAWVLNEKRIVEYAGLDRMQAMFARPPVARDKLVDWLADVEAALADSAPTPSGAV